MSKVIIASLVKISNELDDLKLIEFADEVDSVIKLITASTEDDLIDKKQDEYNELLTTTLPESEQQIKDDKENLNVLRQQYVPNALLALQEALKAKKAREQNIEPEEPNAVLTTPSVPLAPTNKYQLIP